jgi:hypothetical protein
LIGFDPNAKWFENLFENAIGKSNWKMKRNFFAFRPERPSRPNRPARAFPFPPLFLLAGPAHSA